MQRRILFSCVIVFALLAVLLLLWWFNTSPGESIRQSNLQQAVNSAVASPAEFVKNRVTGGIGVVLTVGTTAKLPCVMQVLHGSPAETAGLRPGDVILKVRDWQTTGQPLAQVVEAIRGFTGGSVTVTVQRSNVATNMIFTIQRSSWNSLHVTSSPAPNLPVFSGRFVTNGTTIIVLPAATNQN